MASDSKNNRPGQTGNWIAETNKHYPGDPSKPADPYEKICRDIRFQAVETNKRVIAQWCGVLPGTPNYRHLLRCQHLRVLDEGLGPFRAKPEFTHEWWIWCQKRTGKFTRLLLFRGQFDLGMWKLRLAREQRPAFRAVAIQRAEIAIDECAIAITETIAKSMIKASDPQMPVNLEGMVWSDIRSCLTSRVPSGVNPGDNTDWIWAMLIDQAYKRCPIAQPGHG